MLAAPPDFGIFGVVSFFGMVHQGMFPWVGEGGALIKVSKVIGAPLANLAYNTNWRNPGSKYEYSHDPLHHTPPGQNWVQDRT